MHLHIHTFTTTLLLALPAVIQACVNTFTQVQGNLLDGFITDNGVQVCTASNRARGLDNHFWFDCIRGFAAWTDDGRLVAYAHDGFDYRMRPQSCAEDTVVGGKLILCAGAAFC